MTTQRTPNRADRPTRWALALLLPTALVAGAWTAAGRLTLAPESRLWVDGTSTVRSFSCAATKVDATVGFGDELPAAIAEAGRAIDVVELTVPAAALDCRNGTMNEHMRKALKASEHPMITYRMTSHEVTTRPDGALAVNLTGTLTLGGTEKEITMVAGATQDSAGRYRITGGQELRMTEFGLKPPSLMLGTMKVHDKVVVRFDLVLERPTAIAKTDE